MKATIWQRLEPLTRSEEYDRSLQACVHDPLWLWGRQWQFGELLGEDAGTPIQVRAEVASSTLSRFRLGDAGEPRGYDPDALPLEAMVEREPPGEPSLRARAEAGRRLLTLLRARGAPRTAAAAIGAFPLPSPAEAAAGDPSAAGPAVAAAVRLASVLGGRLPDGLAAAAALRPAGGGGPVLPAALNVPAAEQEAALAAATEFLDWLAEETGPGGDEDCWVGRRLEYRFAVAAADESGETVLEAPEYRGGALDWHDLDLAPGASLKTPPGKAAHQVLELLAAPVEFPGMPAERFWEMEDAAVSFASIESPPESLGQLALVEFATAFGNDWFIVPVPLPYGTLSEVVSLVVTNTFGESQLVEAADGGAAAGGWRMFSHVPLGSGDGPGPLALLPVLAQPLEGGPIEEVHLLRDEQANLVWGVERTVAGADGRGRDRNDEWLASAAALAPPPPASPAPLAYRLQSIVPEHWIPYVAVHDSAQNRGVRLERAAMLRYGEQPPAPVRPSGRLLGEADVLFEEEVTSIGVHFSRTPAACRWLGGSNHAWIGRQVASGRGEGSSGLRFDIAAETE